MGLSAYSRVGLADGGDMRAEDVTAGDVLHEATAGRVVVAKVWNGPAVGMCRVEVANGAMLDLTEDQKVLTPAGLVPAGAITPGAVVRTLDGDLACTEACRLPGDFMVYDIVPEGAAGQCIAANRIWVGL